MPEPTTAAPPKQPAPPEPAAVARLDVVETAQLMRGASEVILRHAGQNYRLRVTRANKLLLIK
ncbi:MAG TPA: hemin uptake protein HemP [Azospirillum sp.]|nr:hemin uptake protein HemP [Azospirillum sp.]